MLAGLGGVWGVYHHYAKGLPALNGLADYRPSLVTRVFARDYQLLGEFFVQRRQFVPMKDVPPLLIHAFLAIEDSKFYNHPGIDLAGIFRAAIANLRAGRVVQGASTITQQVAKTFLLSSARNWKRKIKEVILAWRIEQRFSKDEILELYVNQIYLGAGGYGVGAAARIYFNRDVSELTLGQMAILAALPKAPTNYSPWRHLKRAKKRQKLVLRRMVEVGAVTQEQADLAVSSPLELARPQEPLEQVAPHYLEHVRRSILGEWGGRQLYRGGLDVYTTLDPRLQRVAQDAVRVGLIEYDRRHGYRGPLDQLNMVDDPSIPKKWLKSHKAKKLNPSVFGYLTGLVIDIPNDSQAHLLLENGSEVDLPIKGVRWARLRLEKNKRIGPKIKTIQDVLGVGAVVLVEPPTDKRDTYQLAQEPDADAALVSLDPHTGQILAMVGGYNFADSEFNRATQGRRQPGSAFKPFLYSAALESGLTPVTRIDDSPLSVPYLDADTGGRKVWRPENYEGKFYGPTTLRMGLVHSRNLVTIHLLKKIGISSAVEFLHEFGIDVPKYRQDLSLALGSVGFTPLEMASAYAVFANGGKMVEPIYIARIQDRFGRTVHRHGGGDCLLCHQEPRQEKTEEEGEVTPLFGRPILNPATAYQVTNLLKGVVTHGTGRRARVLKRPLAGKTGTTNDLRDAWFMGFSPSLVTAVWVGMDDSSVLGYRETGAKAALPIWIDFMGQALKDQPITDFPVPPGITLEQIDAETGEPVSEKTKYKVLEAFKLGQIANPIKVTTESDMPQYFDEGIY